jgi:hypothetical protein
VADGCDQVRQEARGFPYCWRGRVERKWWQKDPQGEKVSQKMLHPASCTTALRRPRVFIQHSRAEVTPTSIGPAG